MERFYENHVDWSTNDPDFSKVHCWDVIEHVDLDKIDFASSLAGVQCRLGRGIIHVYISFLLFGLLFICYNRINFNWDCSVMTWVKLSLCVIVQLFHPCLTDTNSDVDPSQPERVRVCGTVGPVPRSVVISDCMGRTD